MVSTSLVTRSAAALEMDTPSQIVIKPSKVDPEKLGVWCKELIKEGTKFGPFVGEKAYEVDDSMDPAYIWEIVDVETKEFLFYINATNPHSGNWMRHIKCARFFEEQNIVSEQEGIDIFYQAIKDISRGEELLTWFEKSPLRRKKGKRRAYPNIKRARTGKPKPSTSRLASGSSKADAYADVNYISQRGRKRSVKKYWQLEAVTDSDANHEDKLGDSDEGMLQELSDEDWDVKEVKQVSKVIEKPAETGTPVESSTGYFQFELQVTQTSKNRLGRKVFQCDICSGIYRHSFSLKRHYIRNHINYKYISKVDRLNCSIVCEMDQRGNKEHKEEEDEEKAEGSDIENTEANADDEDQKEESGSLSDPESGLVSTDPVLERATDSEPQSKGHTGTGSETMSKKDCGIKEEKNDVAVDSEVLAVTEKSSLTYHKSKESKDTKVPASSDLDKKDEESLASSLGTGDKMEEDGKEESSDSKPKVKYPMPGLYRCNICEQLYDTLDQLKEHFMNHPNFPSDKKFACEHCKMKFKHKQNLMRHEVVHTGAKPYICNHCNKRFPTLTNQRRHERIHKGQKFTCSQCPGTFTQTGDLKKHMCKQHPETYNECAYCSKYFSSESILASHLHKAHNKDIEANHQRICARKKARKVSLEKDRAESRRLAIDQAESHSRSDPSLQFACTICRKRFRDYSNMCRHRRLAHEREASNLASHWGNSDEGAFNDVDDYFSDSDSLPDREKMDALQTYFSHVSHNISNNLQHFIEGKEEQLTRASCHIRWKQKNAHDKLAVADKVTEIKLEEFNFPQGFQIRQLSELYESPADLNPATPANEASLKTLHSTDSNSNDCLKQNASNVSAKVLPKAKADAAVDGNPVDQGLMIRVPEIKTCTLCHSVFHSTAAFNDHMTEKHQSNNVSDNSCKVSCRQPTINDDLLEECTPVNYSTKSHDAADVSLFVEKLDNAEQPLDLSASSASLSSSTDAPLPPEPEPDESEPVAESPPQPCVNKQSRKFLCLVCFCEFFNSVELSEHQSNQHPSVDCRHAEVDGNFSATFCKQPNPVGALNVSSSQLPQLPADGQNSAVLPYLCTKCKNQFCSNETLHEHIAECGDYWRHLNTRVTWVFVLRGSELPMEKVIKKRGKFHWTKSPEESSRKQLQRMLLQQHLGDVPADGASAKGRYGRSVGRIKSIESIEDEADLRRTRWRHGHQSSAYNPRRHVRRREMAELVDVQKCRGCDEEFKTILQLERHIPVCAGKNRIKDLHAEKTENGENSDDENDYDPSKHMCIYCERQFTYLRMLKKHVTENCSVRKEFVEKGEYIDEEWEQEITIKVQNSSRDSGQNFGETVATEDADGALDSRRGKRRKRGNNWGCRAKTKKSFKSSKSSDDGDSLFGWEDAFLSTWVKTKDGNQVKNYCNALLRKCDSSAVPAFQKSDESPVAGDICPVVGGSSALQELLTGEISLSFSEANCEKVDDPCASTDLQETVETVPKPVSPKTCDASSQEDPSSLGQETSTTEAEKASLTGKFPLGQETSTIETEKASLTGKSPLGQETSTIEAEKALEAEKASLAGKFPLGQETNTIEAEKASCSVKFPLGQETSTTEVEKASHSVKFLLGQETSTTEVEKASHSVKFSLGQETNTIEAEKASQTVKFPLGKETNTIEAEKDSHTVKFPLGQETSTTEAEKDSHTVKFPFGKETNTIETEKASHSVKFPSERIAADEDMSATDVRQKLISKIQSKQNAKSNDMQSSEDLPQANSTANAGKRNGKDGPEAELDTSTKNEDVKNEDEEGSRTDKDEEEEEEEVPITKTRKRRGPRLTMKSKKRKNVNEKPTAKVSQAKKKPTD